MEKKNERAPQMGFPQMTLRDYFAAFDLYGGIEGFREIIKEVPTLSAQDMNFVCTAFGLKKEELRCYTRRQLRRRHLGC